jgi:hypothetical protein
MAIRKYLARDFTFDTSDDNRVTWTPISGISEWSWSNDDNEEDTSTFDNGAYASAMFTQRGGSFELTGFYLLDSVTGQRDQGQYKVERAATKVGYEAYRDFRVQARPMVSGVRGASIGEIMVTCQYGMTDFGGSTTDVEPWGTNVLWEGIPTGSGIFNIFL